MEDFKDIFKELYLKVTYALDHLLESYLENKVPVSKKQMRSNIPKPKSEGKKIHLWNVNFEEGKALGVKELAAFLEYRDQRQDLSLKGRRSLKMSWPLQAKGDLYDSLVCNNNHGHCRRLCFHHERMIGTCTSGRQRCCK